MTPAMDAATLVDTAWRRGLQPEPQLTVSQWADKHRLLPQASAEPGPWHTDRVPYLRSIMDALSVSSAVERVVFMKGAQLGGTEAGLNWLGYVIHHAPGTMLLVMPSLDMLRRNSRTRIDPLIEATPALRALVAPARSREAGNTIALKEFAGGQLVMTGANAPTGLRSTPVRYLFLDEVDGYPADADGEGDPVALAVQRTATFRGRRKVFLCSTPTVKGASRIEKAYAESDQRRFFVPCRHCAETFTLEWRHVRWPEGRPERAYVACPACGGVIEERDKTALLAGGKWQATAEGDGRTAGFHLSALCSPFETWGEIAREFLSVKADPPRLQAWVNTKLGEAFEDEATAPVEADLLAARAEGDDADTEECSEDEGAEDVCEASLGWSEDVNQALIPKETGSDEDDVVAPENAGDHCVLSLEGLKPRAARLALRATFDPRLGLRPEHINYLSPRPVLRFAHEPADKPRKSPYTIEQELEIFLRRASREPGKRKPGPA